jgi:hypothetical protein
MKYLKLYENWTEKVEDTKGYIYEWIQPEQKEDIEEILYDITSGESFRLRYNYDVKTQSIIIEIDKNHNEFNITAENKECLLHLESYLKSIGLSMIILFPNRPCLLKAEDIELGQDPIDCFVIFINKK